MHVANINEKKYILGLVDDYSRFTWVKFLASKDEAPDFIIKFLKMIQVRLNATVRNIHIDNGTEFVNQTLRDDYEQVGISYETSVERTGVVESENLGKLQAKDDIVLVTATTRAVDLADSPVSTLLEQDALSTNSTYQGSSSNVRPIHALLKLLSRCTKDHPIENVIGDPSRSVSTRKQLQTDAMWCYFDAFLTYVEPKNFKQEMTKPSWIDAM
nr:integrase, catalytic region, zinc finger, CCHC-type, peptidase aspartic, catalytic [Tanacetum cinerariifolium]